MIPSVVGIIVTTISLAMLYLGIHGAPFLVVYPKGHFDPTYVGPTTGGSNGQ